MAILSRVLAPNGALANETQTFLGADSLFTTGTVRFVNSVTGSDNNAGTDPAAPKATLQAAIDLCTANKGDKIIVMAGHAETVTSTSINLSKAGVSIICLGNGLERPTFTYGAAAATITVSAANCAFIGGHHIANFADVAAAFTVGAAKDFQLIRNSFVDAASNLNYLSIVVTGSTNNAADGLSVVGNTYWGLVATANAFVSVLGNLDRLLIADNFVDKAATNDAGQFLTMSSKVCLSARVTANTLILLGATGNLVGIFATGSSTTSTGVFSYNLVTSLDTTTELLDTATLDFAHFENYYTGTIALSGKLWPAADGA